MFGMKIISKKKYNEMCFDLKRVDELNIEWGKKVAKAESDIESIRHQNSELRKKYNKLNDEADELRKFRYDTMKAMGSTKLKSLADLKDLCILRARNYPCDKCGKGDSEKCFKLIFASDNGKKKSQTICVCHKKDAHLFLTAKADTKNSK